MNKTILIIGTARSGPRRCHLGLCLRRHQVQSARRLLGAEARLPGQDRRLEVRPQARPGRTRQAGRFRARDGRAQRQAHRELRQDRQVGLRRGRDLRVRQRRISSEQCHAKTASSRGIGVRPLPHPTPCLMLFHNLRRPARVRLRRIGVSLVPRWRAGGQGFQRDRPRRLAPARLRFRERARAGS